MGLGDRLRTESTPRSPELCKLAVRRHAPWWGFAVYAVFWLFIAGTVGAAFIAAALSSLFSYWEYSKHSDSLWIVCWTIAGTFTIWRLALWVPRRRALVREVARDGVLAPALITNVTTTQVLGALLLRGSATRGRFVHATAGTETFRAMMSDEQAWARTGGPVELVGTPTARFAFMIAPDGTDFLAKRR